MCLSLPLQRNEVAQRSQKEHRKTNSLVPPLSTFKLPRTAVIREGLKANVLLKGRYMIADRLHITNSGLTSHFRPPLYPASSGKWADIENVFEKASIRGRDIALDVRRARVENGRCRNADLSAIPANFLRAFLWCDNCRQIYFVVVSRGRNVPYCF